MSNTNRRALSLISAIIFVFLLLPQRANASDVDRLLDLLVKKHVVTEQEATDLRNQMQADHGQSQLAPEDEKRVLAPRQARNSALSVAAGNQGEQAPPHKSEIPVLGSIPIKLSGYVQGRWTGAVGTTNPFEVRRARLIFDIKPSEQTNFRIHVDAGKSPTLLDARFDWKPSPYANFTVGQFKIPFSQESLVSARDLLTVERTAVGNSLVPGRENGSNGRDIGAQIEGNLFQRGDRPLVSYSLGIFNGAGINRADDNRRKDVAGRLALSPFKGLTLAGDYYDGARGANRTSRDRADLELSFVRGRAKLLGEYIWGHDGTTRKQGWYALGAYRFVPKLEGVFRFDTYNPDLSTPNKRTSTYLGGLNWRVAPWVKLQADYGLVDSQARSDLTNLVQTQLQFQF